MTPGPGRLHIGEENAYFLYGNRTKKSMTLNLQKERGREILLQLVKNADIFVENFRPQVIPFGKAFYLSAAGQTILEMEYL
jgi:crotonobetainyl-CoA:carnitine CoA-transferase CaiB-like acyl-CoA transferase